MSEDEKLAIIKADLDILHADPAKEARLKQCLAAAKEFIKRAGITLSDSPADIELEIMYTSYLYKKRGTNEPMPRMLKYELNNRLLSEKAGGGCQ